MNIFAILSLISCLVIFFLANYVYYKNRHESINILFALHCVILAYYAFCEFMYRQTGNIDTARLWIKISSFWPVSAAVLFHFTLVYINRNYFKNIAVNVLIYAPSLLLSAALFLYSEPVKEYWGYTYLKSPETALIGTAAGIFGTLSFIVFAHYYFKEKDIKKKKQVKFILIGQIFPIIAAIFTEGAAMYSRLPDSIILSLTLFAFFTVYAIRKYELFVVNPVTAADNILSTMPDGLVILNNNFKILEVNKSLLELLEYKREDLIGKPGEILFDNFEKDLTPGQMKDIIKQSIMDKQLIINHEINYISKTGKQIPVTLTGSIIKDKQGNIAGIVGISRDTRRTKQLQEKLLQAEKLAATGQLAGGVAHEINNPMGVILGFSQSVLRRLKEDDPLYMPLKSIEREAIRCKKLVNELLVFSRTGKTTIESIDINTVIEDTLSLVEALTKVKGVALIREYENNIPPVKVNKNQIQQVIINLCSNAVERMPDSGTLTILTKLSGQHIEIRIKDTGKGITGFEKEHFFDPFSISSDTDKSPGLGFSLCFKTIKQHNGTILAESETGRGTTIIITLPLS